MAQSNGHACLLTRPEQRQGPASPSAPPTPAVAAGCGRDPAMASACGLGSLTARWPGPQGERLPPLSSPLSPASQPLHAALTLRW